MYVDREDKLFAIGLALSLLIALLVTIVCIAIGYFCGKGFGLIAATVMLLLLIALLLKSAKKIMNDKDKEQ